MTTPPPEAPDDPPAPAESLRLRAEGPRGVYTRAAFTSVQVNVNGAGNNVVGDAANEPSIAMSPASPNKMAIGWRQFDTIASNFRQGGKAYSTNGGQTWTFPGVLSPGQFRSDPVLDSDAAGNFFYSSLSSVTAAQVFKSVDGGITWTGPASAFGGDKQWLAVDDRVSGLGAGHIYQNWNVQFSCCPPNDLTRSINGGVSFQSPIAIPQPSLKWGANDVGSDGTLYICGSTLNQSGHLVTRSSNAKDPAVTPTFDFVNSVNLGGVTGGFVGGVDPNPGGLLGQVWIAADPSNANRVYMLGSVVPPGGDSFEVMFIRSIDRAQSWSAPVRVTDDPLTSGRFHWFGTLSVSPNGRIDAVWNDTRNTGAGNMSETFHSFSVDSGYTWAPNVVLTPVWDSHLGWPNQNKIGDYYHMISDTGGANLAYAATFNGEQDVYFLRIPADCNNNGIEDDQDVVGGAPDCNGNQIPDVCEPQADCNTNSVQDICDIASGFSTDCNLNHIPDSCESQTDCNNNGQVDFCEIAAGAPDCNGNGAPDDCDVPPLCTTCPDINSNGIPDACEGACCFCSGACSLTTSAGCTQIGGYFSGPGTDCATTTCGAPNDDCIDAITLPSDPAVTVPFNNQCATLDGPDPVTCDAGSTSFRTDLWYEYIAPCDGTIRVSLCEGTSFDTMLAVYGGGTTCACPTGAPQLACGDDNCGIGGGPSEVVLNVTADRCYTIRVGGWNGSVGAGELSIAYTTTCNTAPPAIHWNADVLSPDRTTRSLRFRMQAATTGTPPQAAIKVTMIDLQHPVPPNLPQFLPPDFGEYESATCTAAGEMNGCARWVGKPGTFLESQDVGPSGGTYRAARLQCTPFYYDWVTETASGPITVVGAEIAPSSEYSVQTYGASCTGAETGCPNVSLAVTMYTRRSGDAAPNFNPPSTTGQPDALDVAAVVTKLKNLPGALVKAITQLQPNVPELNANVNALDIVAVVDAVKQKQYAFSGPCVCPSTVTCGGACGTWCPSPNMCVKTCTGGTNDGEPCINDGHCPGGGACGTPLCRDRCGRCTP